MKKEYQAWLSMKRRMSPSVPKSPFHDTNDSICPEWYDFKRFYSDMGTKPSDDHILVRKDITREFSPDNCSWGLRCDLVTVNSRYVMYEGKKVLLRDLCKKYNVNKTTVYNRLKRNRNIYDAIHKAKKDKIH